MSVKKNGSVGNEKVVEKSKKRENVNRSSDNFEPPDGGWGWIIVMACGLSNFCVLPILQNFGLIFKERFAALGISSSQTTTILNINCAVMSCMGLSNGPLFRKFSFRQVSFVGGLICAVSITILATMKNLIGVLFLFSILYAIGVGITMSSNSLALNTYFKKKRRVATGFSWTCTGMGPILVPQIITLLMPIYGVEGTVLIFGSFAFNAVACAVLMQPVSWHAKKTSEKDTVNIEKEETQTLDSNQKNLSRNRLSRNMDENVGKSESNLSMAKGKFGSQYLYYDDEEEGASGIDVIGPGTPMMSRANDGWFSRKGTSTTSLTSKISRRENASRNSSRRQSMNLDKQSNLTGLNKGSSVRTLNRQNSELRCQNAASPLIIVNESCEHSEDIEVCKDPNCNKKLEEKSVEEVETDRLIDEEHPEETKKKSFLEAVIIFFDLDLLRDPIYVNIMLGITLATFAELNFSLLMPFILSEYGFARMQIATVMSILGGVDVSIRLMIPFIADFIGWQNRTFYLLGISCLSLGRIVMAHVEDFGVTIAVSILIGFGKALRTIFMALVIPSHVPLSRLPGATGIQLLITGLLSLLFGPVVGWIRDVTSSYAITLHCLNIFTYLTVISWAVEMYLTKRRSRKASRTRQTESEKLAV